MSEIEYRTEKELNGKYSLKMLLWHFMTCHDIFCLEWQFELYEDDEVGDGGGKHAGEGAPPDLEHPAARDGLRVVNVVHHLGDLVPLLVCQTVVLQSEEPDILEASVKPIYLEI